MERYLERIGIANVGAADSETLRTLQLHHLLAVPFENLDIHLRRPIDVDPQRAIEKIVERRRGGFCYELNGAFAALLTDLGFCVTLLSARAFGANGIAGPEYDHLALRVDLTEPWLVDVGFGDSFRHPLRLTGSTIQSDGWNDYRIEPRDEALVVSRREDGGWRQQFLFTLEPRTIDEFAPMCRYHQTSPESHFTKKRICTIATAEGRLTLSERKLIRTTRDRREERELADEQEWTAVLRERFGVDLESGDAAPRRQPR